MNKTNPSVEIEAEEVIQLYNPIPQIDGQEFESTIEINKADYDLIWQWANQQAEDNWESGDLNINVLTLSQSNPELFHTLLQDQINLGAVLNSIRSTLERAYEAKTAEIRRQRHWARRSLDFALDLIFQKPLKDLPDREGLIDMMFSQKGVLSGLASKQLSAEDCIARLDDYREIKTRAQELEEFRSQWNVRGY
jgi:hypothetical protein